MNMKWENVTPDQYDRLVKAVDLEKNKSVGPIFHVAGFDNNTLRVTDIWESADKFNSFVQNYLMPETQKLGISNQPQVEIFPAHYIYPQNK